MSLIIDALRKAQQLRLNDFQGVPFFKPQQPSDEKRRVDTGRKRLLLGLGLFLLLAGLLMIGLNPFSSFHGEKTTTRIALPEREKSSILVAEKKPEEPVKAPASSRIEEIPIRKSESAAVKSEEPLVKQREEVKKPIGSKALQRLPVENPLSPPSKVSSPPLEKRQSTEGEISLSPVDAGQGPRQAHLSSSDVLTLYNQGVLYQNQGEMAKAIHAYQKVIELDPAYFEAYNNLGILYQEIGDFERAAQAYQRSIEINPGYVKALNNLGILFYLKGRYEEALASFQKALSIAPDNIESHLNLGVLFKKQGQWDKAMNYFKDALLLNPSQGEAHYNMALLYEQADRFELAVDHYQRFIQLSSKTYPALVSKVQRHIDSLIKTRKQNAK